MKKLRLLWEYSSGVRLVSLILLVVSCYALFSTVQVVGNLKTAYDNYAFIRDADLHDAYAFVNWNNVSRTDEEYEKETAFYAAGGMGTLFREMEKCAAVASLGTIGRYYHPLYDIKDYDPENPDSVPEKPIVQSDGSYSFHYDHGVYIYMLSPGLFDFFPNMRSYFPFEDPEGVYILGDDIFEGVGKGDILRCYSPTVTEMGWSEDNTVYPDTVYPGFTAEFSVEGRYGLPFAMPNITGAGGTTAHESDIVTTQETPILVALDTAENREKMASVGFVRDEYPFNFYLRYREDATKEEIAEVEDIFTFLGGLTPVENVQIELAARLETAFLEQIPSAVLRISIMLLCYVSLIALTVNKKRKEIAVSYICGETKEGNARRITALLFFVTLPAGVLSLLYLYLAPYYYQMMEWRIDPSFMHFVRNGMQTCTVLVYFALMLLLGWALVKGIMGKRSPMEYFKETAQ